MWSGESLHGVNIAGGLHHAMPDRASGFCIYNDVAVGIQQLLDHGAERVAYVDVDVHHGDGVERIFWDDPRVLTISLHETGQMLFPGTGFPTTPAARAPRAPRSTSRCRPAPPTPAGCARSTPSCRRCCASSRPEILVTQHGCDTHIDDPLAHLMLTVDGQRAAYLALHDLAHEVADGRWVATGGGGYALVDVVPRAWTHLLAIVAGRPLDARDRDAAGVARPRRGACWARRAPHRMTDGRTPAYRDWSRGLRPRHLAGPRDPRHAHGGLPAARPRPAALTDRRQQAASGKDSSRHAASPTSFFGNPLPHESHQALFSRERHACDTGGEAGAVPRQKIGAPWLRRPLETCPRSQFLTVAEVAAMMRVSKMTVYRLVHNGELPAVRVGRSFRVTEDDVNEYLRKSFYSAG